MTPSSKTPRVSKFHNVEYERRDEALHTEGREANEKNELNLGLGAVVGLVLGDGIRKFDRCHLDFGGLAIGDDNVVHLLSRRLDLQVVGYLIGSCRFDTHGE